MKFKYWLEELGLGDITKMDNPIRFKQGILRNKHKLPQVPTYSWERGNSIAKKTVESEVPKYRFDITQRTGTRLDPGS